MKKEILQRTKRFAIDCWKFCANVPKSREYNAYVNQLIRSSSSVGANYRAAQRAKSTADFIHKLKIVEEEADESLYWLEIFQEIGKGFEKELKSLQNEGEQLLAITVASINTTRRNQKK